MFLIKSEGLPCYVKIQNCSSKIRTVVLGSELMNEIENSIECAELGYLGIAKLGFNYL